MNRSSKSCYFSPCDCSLSRNRFFIFIPLPPRSPLFPYTTLFRSVAANAEPTRTIDLKALMHAGHNQRADPVRVGDLQLRNRKSTRLNSSHVSISYAVFCLKKKKAFPPRL